MSKPYTFELTLNLDDLVGEALSGVDLSGLGPSEMSEYEITDHATDLGEITFAVLVTIDRVEGAHASRDSIEDRIRDALGEVEHCEVVS